MAAASAAAAASAPLLLDAYPHSVRLVLGGARGGGGEPFELFKPGTQLPQRRIIEVPNVGDDMELSLVEAAKSPAGADKNLAGPTLAGGGSRLPASVGATKSGTDPAPFAGYKISGVKAAVKTFAKAEEAARWG